MARASAGGLWYELGVSTVHSTLCSGCSGVGVGRGSTGFNQGWGFVKPLGRGTGAKAVAEGGKTVAGSVDRQVGNWNSRIPDGRAGKGDNLGPGHSSCWYLVGAGHHCWHCCQHGPRQTHFNKPHYSPTR